MANKYFSKEWNGSSWIGKSWRLTWVSVSALYILIVVIGAAAPLKTVDNTAITKTEAQLICLSAYRSYAKYDVDVGALDIKAVFDVNDKWKVIISGKMQNGFGAWEKVIVGCYVHKEAKDKDNHYSLQNVASFKYH